MTSMIIENKFKTKQEFIVAENDLRAKIFGENTIRNQNEFHSHFSLVDPRVTMPSFFLPDYKVHEFLTHTNDVNHEAWVLGKTCFNRMMRS